MSRIGRHPIAIPAGVTVEIAENNVVTVKGPKGTLEKALPVISSLFFPPDQNFSLQAYTRSDKFSYI